MDNLRKCAGGHCYLVLRGGYSSGELAREAPDYPELTCQCSKLCVALPMLHVWLDTCNTFCQTHAAMVTQYRKPYIR